ncbi:hypothetical protein ACFC1R_32865 [Kitasatospora sp. NPDC056138]|uniref:hypothetical protein n=1 Tax=Kitasatospora sp. NPDC056138 TaxID=3345724 RepID=UPI0035D8EAFB
MSRPRHPPPLPARDHPPAHFSSGAVSGLERRFGHGALQPEEGDQDPHGEGQGHRRQYGPRQQAADGERHEDDQGGQQGGQPGGHREVEVEVEPV